jgi:hypothetical protein
LEVKTRPLAYPGHAQLLAVRRAFPNAPHVPEHRERFELAAFIERNLYEYGVKKLVPRGAFSPIAIAG